MPITGLVERTRLGHLKGRGRARGCKGVGDVLVGLEKDERESGVTVVRQRRGI